jgi:hypothetical protein
VEERVIGNDYTFSFAGQRYQIARAAVQAGRRRQRVRVEVRRDGELKARYQGCYLEIQECVLACLEQPSSRFGNIHGLWRCRRASPILRSQFRRLSFGQPRQALPRLGYAHIAAGFETDLRTGTFYLAGNRNFYLAPT